MLNQSLSATFNPTSTGHHLYTTDNNHIIIGCNEWQAKDVGLRHSGELIGKPIFNFYSAVESDVFIENNETILKTGNSQLFEEFFQLKDGARTVVSTYKYPLRNEKNAIVGVSGMSFPIEYISHNLVNVSEHNLPADIQRLTPKQLLCLYFLLSGFLDSKLAQKMGVTKNTIEQYIAHILIKLKCNHLSALITEYASRADMLEWLSSFQFSLLYDLSYEEERLIPHAYEDDQVKLTKQQHRCFQLLLEGNTARAIASAMNLSYRTIQHYTAYIYERLGVANGRELIRHYAYLVK